MNFSFSKSFKWSVITATTQLKHSIRGIIDIQSPLIWVEVSNAFLFYIIFQSNISLIQFSNSKHSNQIQSQQI